MQPPILELLRVTEAAALAAARWCGSGRQLDVDQAAVDAMRVALATVAVDGVVVIGEGEKDHAPMLANGERVGGGGPPVDIAVDPVDGTRAAAEGAPGALAVIAMTGRGSLFYPGPIMYMDKIVVGRRSAGLVDLDAPVARNLAAVAQARGVPVSDVVAAVLDRPRNAKTMASVEAAGARLERLPYADLAAAIACGIDGRGIDIVLGIGGSPEAIIAGCALAGLGGEIQCRAWPRDQLDRDRAAATGIDLGRVLGTADLAGSAEVSCAMTGITASALLDGLRVDGDRVEAHSLLVSRGCDPFEVRRWHYRRLATPT